MKNKKRYVSVVTDTAFFAFLTFLAALTVLNRFVKRPYSIIFAALISFIFAVAIFAFLLSRKKKRGEKLKQKENADLYLLQLAFMQKSEAAALLFSAFEKYGKPFKKNRLFFTLPSENCVYFLSQGVDGASKADVVKLYNFLKDGERGVIFSSDVSADVLTFSSRFGGRITVLGGDKTYKFLKNNDALPKIKFFPLKERETKPRIKNFLDRKKAVKFMLFGLGFAMMSFIVRYNVYYVITGCAFLMLAAAAAIFGKTETPT